MAKKTPKKDPTEKTTTYSTRLNDEQRSLLEEAASIAGVSAAKLIRDAALRAAADTVNSQGPNEAAIMSSMYTLAGSLKNPQATVTFHSSEIEYTTERTIAISNADTSLDGCIQVNGTDDIEFVPTKIRAHFLSVGQIRTLREIAVNCPITFSDAFRRAIDGADEKTLTFTPRANPQSLIDE